MLWEIKAEVNGKFVPRERFEGTLEELQARMLALPGTLSAEPAGKGYALRKAWGLVRVNWGYAACAAGALACDEVARWLLH